MQRLKTEAEALKALSRQSFDVMLSDVVMPGGMTGIELARRCPQALCVALHPGTVDTPLSAPFAKTGLNVRPPQVAAQELLHVIDTLPAGSSGGFFDHQGKSIPW